jgi:hypothetical protein
LELIPFRPYPFSRTKILENLHYEYQDDVPLVALRHTQASGTETRPVEPAQNTDHELIYQRAAVSQPSMQNDDFFVVLVPILVLSVILQIVSFAFLKVSFR